jgi:hypothetical protein
MSPQLIFPVNLVLGYVAWLLCLSTYIWPKLKAMDSVSAQRAIATLHSFRFFGRLRHTGGLRGFCHRASCYPRPSSGEGTPALLGVCDRF